MVHILNVKMWHKNFLYILFNMRMEDKPYKINFELGILLQIILWVESFVVNYLQLEGSLHISYYFIYYKYFWTTIVNI